MPLIRKSTYRAPLFLNNGHLQTIFPSLFRRVPGVSYQRQQIFTPDGDFLDLDWSVVGGTKLAIISHGLEGSSQREYVRGMVRAVNRRGRDALAWNMRGCGGRSNHKPRFSHSGASEDLHAVVEHVRCHCQYQAVMLLGFSLGGNMTLKYLGEEGKRLWPGIKGAVVFSVPCDLAGSACRISQWQNRIYQRRFLRLLHKRIKAMKEVLPEEINDDGYEKIRTLQDFDDRYTAPLHGFQDARDYWRQSSCNRFLPLIQVPALLVNAGNDPFLSASCYPVEAARQNGNLYLEVPQSGGHVGFVAFGQTGEYWSEWRAVTFMKRIC
ncbi:MAG: alpha/beta fold hydrolase [Deltaproteobacteria bacterium]|nr:alpha/beta fold hydrolase [Deltaproteobacteria bacterium]MBW2072142.1 alpha/beta fold hydrolase [Deltaproteobacteria bacterium]